MTVNDRHAQVKDWFNRLTNAWPDAGPQEPEPVEQVERGLFNELPEHKGRIFEAMGAFSGNGRMAGRMVCGRRQRKPRSRSENAEPRQTENPRVENEA